MPPTRPTPRKLTAHDMKAGEFQRKSYGDYNISMGWDGDTYFVSAFNYRRGKYVFQENFRTVAAARKHYEHAEALIVAGHQNGGQTRE